MNEMVLANQAADWRRLKMLALDSVSSPITGVRYRAAALVDFGHQRAKLPLTKIGLTRITEVPHMQCR
jgi:hypothetical protein